MGPLGCTVVFKVVVLQRIWNENGILDSGVGLNCAYWLPVSPPHPGKFPRLNGFSN